MPVAASCRGNLPMSALSVTNLVHFEVHTDTSRIDSESYDSVINCGNAYNITIKICSKQFIIRMKKLFHNDFLGQCMRVIFKTSFSL